MWDINNMSNPESVPRLSLHNARLPDSLVLLAIKANDKITPENLYKSYMFSDLWALQKAQTCRGVEQGHKSRRRQMEVHVVCTKK